MQSNRSSSHRGDYLAPLTDEELRLIGPPPQRHPAFGYNFVDERSIYRRNRNRANETMQYERNELNHFNRLSVHEQERAFDVEMSRVNRMIPHREEYWRRPDVFAVDEESEDDEWIEEWNRGMREIEQEIEDGVYNYEQSSQIRREPPVREVALVNSARRQDPIENRRDKTIKRKRSKSPAPQTVKDPSYQPKSKIDVTQKSGRKRGRPKKFTISNGGAQIPTARVKEMPKLTEYRKMYQRKSAMKATIAINNTKKLWD